MAGSGFGFSPYPQRPSVSPKDVGQLLQARMMKQQADATAVAPAPMSAPTMQSPGAVVSGPPPVDTMRLKNDIGNDAMDIPAQFLGGNFGGSLDAMKRSVSQGDSLMNARAGNIEASAPGDKIGGDEHLPSAFTIMAREMVQRSQGMGGAFRGQQPAPGSPNNDPQLMQLGMSPEELRLMKMIGALK